MCVCVHVCMYVCACVICACVQVCVCAPVCSVYKHLHYVYNIRGHLLGVGLRLKGTLNRYVTYFLTKKVKLPSCLAL